MERADDLTVSHVMSLDELTQRYRDLFRAHFKQETALKDEQIGHLAKFYDNVFDLLNRMRKFPVVPVATVPAAPKRQCYLRDSVTGHCVGDRTPGAVDFIYSDHGLSQIILDGDRATKYTYDEAMALNGRRRVNGLREYDVYCPHGRWW